MKVHLVRRETIESYAARNARSKPSFAGWLTAVKYADWNVPSNIKQTFGSADLLGNGSSRVVFDIGGNNYRIICKFHSVTNRFIYSFAGSVPTLNTISSVITTNNIR